MVGVPSAVRDTSHHHSGGVAGCVLAPWSLPVSPDRGPKVATTKMAPTVGAILVVAALRPLFDLAVASLVGRGLGVVEYASGVLSALSAVNPCRVSSLLPCNMRSS